MGIHPENDKIERKNIMKKFALISLVAVSAAACSLMGSANLGPKMVVTCQGVPGSITLTAQEATDFVKDVKDLKKDSPICLKNQETTEFCINLLKASSKKCSAKAAAL